MCCCAWTGLARCHQQDGLERERVRAQWSESGCADLGRSLKSPSSSFLSCKFRLRKPKLGSFPGGPLVKNPPSRAGDTGLIPDQGAKIQPAAWQPSPHAVPAEPQ